MTTLPVFFDRRDWRFHTTLPDGTKLQWGLLGGITWNNGYAIVLAHTDKPLARLLRGEIAYTLIGMFDLETTIPVPHTFWVLKNARIALDKDGSELSVLLTTDRVYTYKYAVYTIVNGAVATPEQIEATHLGDVVRVVKTIQRDIPIAEFNLNKLPR